MEEDGGKSLIRKESKKSKEMYFLASVVGGIVVLDQGIKIWMHKASEIQIIPDILTFRISQNTNAAYGIGSNSTWMYVVTNLIILGVIFKFITTQNEFVDKKFKICLSLILAGGVSNVIERIFRGYVTEFIDFGHNFPMFNLADIFILIGWVAVAGIFAIFTGKEWKNKKKGME